MENFGLTQNPFTPQDAHPRQKVKAYLHTQVHCPDCNGVMLRSDDGEILHCSMCGNDFKTPVVILERVKQKFESNTVQDGYYITQNGNLLNHWEVCDLLNAYDRLLQKDARENPHRLP